MSEIIEQIYKMQLEEDPCLITAKSREQSKKNGVYTMNCMQACRGKRRLCF